MNSPELLPTNGPSTTVVPCYVYEDQPGTALSFLKLGLEALESGDIVQSVVTMSRVDTAQWSDPSGRWPVTVALYFGTLAVTGVKKPFKGRLLQLPGGQVPLDRALDQALRQLRSWRESLLAPVAEETPDADRLDTLSERVGLMVLAAYEASGQHENVVILTRDDAKNGVEAWFRPKGRDELALRPAAPAVQDWLLSTQAGHRELSTVGLETTGSGGGSRTEAPAWSTLDLMRALRDVPVEVQTALSTHLRSETSD